MYYLGLNVEFTFDLDDSHLVEDLHKLYKKYGFVLDSVESDDGTTYEDAVKANQKCYDERIDGKEQKEYTIHWLGEFTSFMITKPDIEVDENSRIDKYYSTSRREMILFPEEEITDEVFAKILELVTDLYHLDYVYKIEIQKE